MRAVEALKYASMSLMVLLRVLHLFGTILAQELLLDVSSYNKDVGINFNIIIIRIIANTKFAVACVLFYKSFH